jgi:hypothetical protein
MPQTHQTTLKAFIAKLPDTGLRSPGYGSPWTGSEKAESTESVACGIGEGACADSTRPSGRGVRRVIGKMWGQRDVARNEASPCRARAYA